MIHSSIMLMQPFPPSTKFPPLIHKEHQFTLPTGEDKFVAQLLKLFNKGNPGNLKPKLHLMVMVVVSRSSLTVKKTRPHNRGMLQKTWLGTIHEKS